MISISRVFIYRNTLICARMFHNTQCINYFPKYGNIRANNINICIISRNILGINGFGYTSDVARKNIDLTRDSDKLFIDLFILFNVNRFKSVKNCFITYLMHK